MGEVNMPDAPYGALWPIGPIAPIANEAFWVPVAYGSMDLCPRGLCRVVWGMAPEDGLEIGLTPQF